ncbi:Uncharacterised protein [Mycobacteroides abscessus subsp. massiliense]|nr:Uncharacterised protein [Mycobacteroides abscessus subsp. massiliense]
MDVTAEAAPARSNGIPLTAALVIGAFTIANPAPKIAKVTSSSQIGVASDTLVKSSEAVKNRVPAASSDGRAPNRPTIRPDIGENTSAPTAIGR